MAEQRVHAAGSQERAALLAAALITGLVCLGAAQIDYAPDTERRIAGYEHDPIPWQTCDGDPIRGLALEPGKRAVRSAAPLCASDDADGRLNLACDQGEVLVGVHGSVDRLLHRVGGICGDGDHVNMGPTAGGFGGRRFELLCPSGEVVTAIRTGRPRSVKAIQVQCGADHGSPVR